MPRRKREPDFRVEWLRGDRALFVPLTKTAKDWIKRRKWLDKGADGAVRVGREFVATTLQSIKEHRMSCAEIRARRKEDQTRK